MKSKKQILITLLVACTASSVWANPNMVAKVLILRGQVKEKLADGTITDVKENQDIPEGAILQTAEKSFVKLIFVDKSQMNLGPNSQMVINAFPKKEAGIITLVKGQLRSQVTKDYMEMDDKSKSKLFIKTNSAAMGIRGTDFQVNYNPENQNTALITFEGAVAMSHLDRNLREDKFDQSKLEKVVSNEKAVMVTGGHVSAVNLNVAERAMIPTKLAPTQIEALKENETGIKDNSSKSESKQFRNPIPPGADGSAFSNSAGDVEKVVKNLGGKTDIADSNKTDKHELANNTKGDPSGFFNEKTGEYKLPAGSIIDLKTVNIIPPPTNAVFDPNTKTFTVPDSFGKVDKATGEYKAPEGLKLTNDGKFQVIDQDAFMKNQVKVNEKGTEKKADPNSTPGIPGAPPVGMGPTPTDGRAPASVGTAPIAGGMLPPSLNEIRPDMQIFANQFAPAIIDRPPVMNDQLKALAQDKILTTEKVNQINSNLGGGTGTTNVKIILNAQ